MNRSENRGRVPLVLAFTLEQARRVLEEHGLPYVLKETAPTGPRGRKGENIGPAPPSVLRVIRQTEGRGGVVELVVARENAAR